MTPQDREQFYSHMVDRYVDRMSGTYELNDEQKTQVRSKLDEIKGQQKQYFDKIGPEYNSIHEESHRLRDAEHDGTPIDKQRQQQVEQRLQELRQNSPLMNPERITQEVEKLLPPEQVERGRARQQAERQQWDQRRAQMRQQFDLRRQQRAGAGDPASPASPPPGGFGMGPPPGDFGGGAAASQPSGRGGRGSMRDRFSSRGSRGRGGEQVGSFRGGRDDSGEAITRNGRRDNAIRENPISPWEQYIRDFIRTYSLDEAQQATAWSVYREMQERRVAHEQTHRVDYEDARKIQDAGQREQKLNDLNKVIVGLFDELKLRLMRVPSTTQRIAVEGRSMASQPS